MYLVGVPVDLFRVFHRLSGMLLSGQMILFNPVVLRNCGAGGPRAYVVLLLVDDFGNWIRCISEWTSDFLHLPQFTGSKL